MTQDTLELPVTVKQRLLRIHLDGEWTAHEFRRLFDALNKLYRFFALTRAECLSIRDFQKQSLAQLDPKLVAERLDSVVEALLFFQQPALTRAEALKKGFFASVLKKVEGVRDPDLRTLQKFSEMLRQFASGITDIAKHQPLGTDLYGLIEQAQPQDLLSRAVLRPEHAHLQVRRCRYASLGITDLAGVAQTLGHLKDLVLALIQNRNAVNERKLREELLAEELRSARLKNVAQQIELLKSVGYSDSECRHLLIEVATHGGFLLSCLQRDIITQAEMIEEDG